MEQWKIWAAVEFTVSGETASEAAEAAGSTIRALEFDGDLTITEMKVSRKRIPSEHEETS